jgi:hypothetical protein
MEDEAAVTPLRCPQCDAWVVDRRSPSCTTCHAALPPGWVLSPEQVGKLEAIDQAARSEHASAMNALEPDEENTTLTDVDSSDQS